MANLPDEQIQPRGVVPFIDMEFTPVEKKQTPQYSRQILESAYSFYVNNKTELSWDVGTYIDELRLIGQGRQSADYYKRYFSSGYDSGINVMSDIDTYFSNSAEANRYGWMNVIWDNLSPIANIKTIIKAIVKNTDYDIRANVIDINATDEEDRRMMKEYAKAKYKDQLDFLRGKWGLAASQNMPISDEYTDLLEIKKQGGFKAHYILGIEQLLKWTENYSGWDDNLKERFLDDLFDLRYAFAAVDYDSLSNKPKWKWVDAKDVLIQTTNTHDFNDSDYRGYFDYPTVNDLRKGPRLYDGEKYISTKEEWMALGKEYAEYMGNPTKADLNKISIDNNSYSGVEGSVRVCRLNLYWKDYEVTNEVEFENRYGSKKRRAYKDGEKLSERDKLVSNRVEKTYYAQWIVGTKWMQHWGAMENMPRKNQREALCPMVGVKLLEKSFTERLAPLAHMFAIAWIRLCNAISKAQNDFYLIDFNALADMTDNTGKLSWQDMIRMMREENVFLWDSSRQTPSIGGNGAPVQKVPGTLLEDMAKELELMNQMYAKIEQLIGIPPVALGVTPTNNQAVRTTQMSVASSSTALNMLISYVMRVKKGLSEVTCSMWQNAIKYSDRCRMEASKVIGSDDVEGILAARSEYAELGIDLQARPSDELIDTFIQLIMQEIARKNQGQAGIDAIDGTWLIHSLKNGGNFYEALYRAKYLKKKDEKRLQAEKEAAIQQQGQVLDQNARTAAEEERKTEQMKSQQAMIDAQAKASYDAMVQDKEFSNKVKEKQIDFKAEKEGKSPIESMNELEAAFRAQQNMAQNIV